MVGSFATTWDVVTGSILRSFQNVLGRQAAASKAVEAAQMPFSAPSRLFSSRLVTETKASTSQRPGLRKTGLSKSEAEDLLDWLEAHGQFGQLSFVPGEGFTVS